MGSKRYGVINILGIKMVKDRVRAVAPSNDIIMELPGSFSPFLVGELVSDDTLPFPVFALT